MIIYNVTIQLDAEIQTDWLQWMKKDHIPKVMATGQFLDYRILRLLDEHQDVVTFAVQYQCAGKEQIDQYQDIFAPALQAEHKNRYDGRFVAFRSLLELIDAE